MLYPVRYATPILLSGLGSLARSTGTVLEPRNRSRCASSSPVEQQSIDPGADHPGLGLAPTGRQVPNPDI